MHRLGTDAEPVRYFLFAGAALEPIERLTKAAREHGVSRLFPRLTELAMNVVRDHAIAIGET
jgi:hypothetical protein